MLIANDKHHDRVSNLTRKADAEEVFEFFTKQSRPEAVVNRRTGEKRAENDVFIN